MRILLLRNNTFSLGLNIYSVNKIYIVFENTFSLKKIFITQKEVYFLLKKIFAIHLYSYNFKINFNFEILFFCLLVISLYKINHAYAFIPESIIFFRNQMYKVSIILYNLHFKLNILKIYYLLHKIFLIHLQILYNNQIISKIINNNYNLCNLKYSYFIYFQFI